MIYARWESLLLDFERAVERYAILKRLEAGLWKADCEVYVKGGVFEAVRAAAEEQWDVVTKLRDELRAVLKTTES